MKKRNAKNTMILWEPDTGDVLLVPWPSVYNSHPGYWSGFACYSDFRRASYKERQCMVFVEAMHLIIRDGIDPVKLHHVLMELEEYSSAMAEDVPR